MSKQLSTLIDSQIIGADGREVGAIDELILSESSGQVLLVVVQRPDRSRFCVNWSELTTTPRGFRLKNPAYR